jgi:hypothetical protein
MGLGHVREALGAVLLTAGLLAAPAAAQGPLGSDPLDVARGDHRLLWDETTRAAGGDGGPAVGAFGQRVDLGLVDVGFSIAPRRLLLDNPADSASAAVRYRLGDIELPRNDVGLELRLRWPAAVTGALPLQPYVSVGPSLSRALVDDPSPMGRQDASRPDSGLGFGMRGSVGLTWQLAPDAALYGEYRVTRDRPFSSRHGGEAGTDLFYGFSLKF